MEDITKNNKLIAEFLGHTRTGDTYNIPNEHPYLHQEYLKYHKSWDWLMPVVEKIEKVKGAHVIITTGTLCEIFHFGKLISRSNCAGSKIEGVYQAVIGFINNQNTLK